MDDVIYRQAAIDAMLKLQAEDDEMYGCRIPEGFDGDRAKEALEQLPSAQTTINGYDIRHLALIADILRRENVPPERVLQVLTDIGRIIAIVKDEFEEALRKAVVWAVAPDDDWYCGYERKENQTIETRSRSFEWWEEKDD